MKSTEIVADQRIGPAGELLHLLDRHPYRPAHIHIIVSDPLYISRN